MDKLKVCFVGVGSIAKRHIMNLNIVCREKGIILTMDALRREDSLLPEETGRLICHTYLDSSLLPTDYDILFVTNPTEYHLDVLKRFHNHAKNFFIEKPLTSYEKLREVSDIAYRPDSVYYVACPLRYTGVIQYIKQNIDPGEVLSVRCISSSYLPDWRPGTDYRKTYSASKKLGGGVSMDLIHEWDYLSYLFGQPQRINYTCGKRSALEIDCEDYAVYVAEYADKVLELHLDYFGKKTVREIMLITERDTIVGDLANNRIRYLKSGRMIDFSEERDSYQRQELRHYLGMLQGAISCDNGIRKACQTLRLTQGMAGSED